MGFKPKARAERGATYKTRFGSYLCLDPKWNGNADDVLLVDLETGKCFVGLSAEVYPVSGKIFFSRTLAAHRFGDWPDDERYAEGLFPAGPKPWEQKNECSDF